MTTFLMGIGLILGIFTISFTFTMYSIFPLYVYWYCPFVSLSIVIIVNLTLPLTHKAQDDSQALLKLWLVTAYYADERWFSKLEKKIMLRKLNSLRPFRFYASIGRHNLFLLKKSTKGTFYWVMMEKAINYIIGVNTELFEDIGEILI